MVEVESTAMSPKVSRRQFVAASGLFAAWAALAGCGPKNFLSVASGTATPSTPVPPATPDVANATTLGVEATGNALLAHVLRRLTFGAPPELVEHARSVGVDGFIDEQLHPERIDDSRLDPMLAPLTTLTMTPAERFALKPQGQAAQELTFATLLRQVYSQRQLFELVVDFWTNHFNIYIGKSACRVLKTDDDQQVIRPNALGNFGDLLNGSAHSPAMLVYLDQAESTQNVPNENYARELMELHTVSTAALFGPPDVVGVARAFTGWTIVGQRGQGGPAGSFIFRPRMHDDGEKDLLGVHLPAGQGEADGQQVLALLSQSPLTARFISTKLVRRFVADDPPPALVDRLAATFTASQGDARGVLQALFVSSEFRSSAGLKFKRPLEFFVSALRLTGAELTGRPRPLVEKLRLLGQLPFQWQMPNGYPDVGGYWATTGGLLNRWNFGMDLAAGMLAGTQVDLQALTRDAGSPADVVDVLSQRFTGERLPDNARNILVDFAGTGDLGRNLAAVAGLILGSPHFQLR
jgi:uncharacterized protein (DUF1800 family)